MRKVISISMPAEQVKQVKEKAKKRGFDSVSSYVNYLVDEDDDLISVDELRKMADRAQAEYKAGKSIKADSLADLI